MVEVQVKAKFPSVEWFRALKERMNGREEKYRAMGFADSRSVFKVKAEGPLREDRLFTAIFDVYECAEVRELAEADLETFDADWILEGGYESWKEMIENIRAKGQADSDHSLNRLTLLGHPMLIHGSDQLRVDLFFRAQITFQAYIEESAHGETLFA